MPCLGSFCTVRKLDFSPQTVGGWYPLNLLTHILHTATTPIPCVSLPESIQSVSKQQIFLSRFRKSVFFSPSLMGNTLIKKAKSFFVYYKIGIKIKSGPQFGYLIIKTHIRCLGISEQMETKKSIFQNYTLFFHDHTSQIYWIKKKQWRG